MVMRLYVHSLRTSRRYVTCQSDVLLVCVSLWRMARPPSPFYPPIHAHVSWRQLRHGSTTPGTAGTPTRASQLATHPSRHRNRQIDFYFGVFPLLDGLYAYQCNTRRMLYKLNFSIQITNEILMKVAPTSKVVQFSLNSPNWPICF